MNRHHLMIIAPVAAFLAAPALAQTTTTPTDPMNRQTPTYDSQMQPDPAKPRTSDMDPRTDAQRRAGPQQPGQTEVPQPPPQPEVPQPVTPPESPTSPLPPPRTTPPQPPTPPQA
jgi:hypothetical protein